MDIRTAGAAEMLALWGENPDHLSPTARFNCENIESGSATLFVWDRDGVLVGELYLFRSLSDPDFADGKKRAYFCALRIQKNLRGQGLGTALMEHVIAQAAREGFRARLEQAGERKAAELRARLGEETALSIEMDLEILLAGSSADGGIALARLLPLVDHICVSAGEREAEVIEALRAAGAEEPDLFQAVQLERKLEKALSQVEGAGEVSVVLTLDAGPRQVIAQDGTAVQEADKTSRETTSVLLSKGSGTQEAVRLQELAPAYRGALVVAQGGDDPLVRLALNQAVSALTGLGADQISICKGK